MALRYTTAVLRSQRELARAEIARLTKVISESRRPAVEARR